MWKFFVLSAAIVVSPLLKASESTLNLEVRTPHVFYQLKKNGSYLRYRLYGQEVGFYLKGCHKDVVETLEKEIKNSFLSLGRFPASGDDSYGSITNGGKSISLGKKQYRASSFSGLEMKIFRLMKLGKKSCS